MFHLHFLNFLAKHNLGAGNTLSNAEEMLDKEGFLTDEQRAELLDLIDKHVPKFHVCYIGRGVANSCYYGKTGYMRKGDATRKCNKLNAKDDKPSFEVIDRAELKVRQNTMVEVINMMSGKPVMIPLTDVGGCTDPSTETYWSM